MTRRSAEQRILLAQIAECEGRLERQGNENKAGAAIEPKPARKLALYSGKLR